MEKIKLKQLHPLALLQSGWRSVLPLLLVSLSTLIVSCSTDDESITKHSCLTLTMQKRFPSICSLTV